MLDIVGRTLRAAVIAFAVIVGSRDRRVLRGAVLTDHL
jgi:hypothetical protein